MLKIIYRQTITLFNRYRNNDKIYWYPLVIPNVHLVPNRAKIISMYGELSQDNVLLHIQYTPIGSDAVVQGKKFLEPIEYEQKNDPTSYFTFNMGDHFDFFMEGAWSGGVVDDDTYSSGFFDYMNHSKDHVWVVSNYSQYFLLPHFELTGR